ncbi:MAG: hypothetical protein ACYDH6_16110 [Acidimicrobiales bacterium]
MLKQRLVVIVGALGLLSSACGTTNGTPHASPPPTIGRLHVNSDAAAAMGNSATPLPPLAVGNNFMPCRDLAAFMGEPVYTVPNPPAAWGLPACFIDGTGNNRSTYYEPAKLPDKTKPYFVGVWYIPTGQSPYVDNLDQLSHAGGVLFEMEIGETEFPLAPASAEVDSAGHRVGTHTDVNGNLAWVAATPGGDASVQWWGSDRLGRRVLLYLGGSYCADGMLATARSLVQALPAHEYPLQPPPPPVQPGTPSGASGTPPTTHPSPAVRHLRPYDPRNAPVETPPCTPTGAASTTPTTPPSPTTTSTTASPTSTSTTATPSTTPVSPPSAPTSTPSARS